MAGREPCRLHKSRPLFSALEDHDVGFTALRRAQSRSRTTLQEVASFVLSAGTKLRKVSRLANWTTEEVTT